MGGRNVLETRQCPNILVIPEVMYIHVELKFGHKVHYISEVYCQTDYREQA